MWQRTCDKNHTERFIYYLHSICMCSTYLICRVYIFPIVYFRLKTILFYIHIKLLSNYNLSHSILNTYATVNSESIFSSVLSSWMGEKVIVGSGYIFVIQSVPTNKCSMWRNLWMRTEIVNLLWIKITPPNRSSQNKQNEKHRHSLTAAQYELCYCFGYSIYESLTHMFCYE